MRVIVDPILHPGRRLALGCSFAQQPSRWQRW
jgi:hypothetical protein